MGSNSLEKLLQKEISPIGDNLSVYSGPKLSIINLRTFPNGLVTINIDYFLEEGSAPLLSLEVTLFSIKIFHLSKRKLYFSRNFDSFLSRILSSFYTRVGLAFISIFEYYSPSKDFDVFLVSVADIGNILF